MTHEQYAAELNKYPTSEIAKIFKVSESAVEEWKAGQPSGFPGQWEIVVKILKNKYEKI